ncbi:MAG: NnrU family protein [Alphaproteobacteria bacterium]|nr:NnrU family protein [Alphaproteobacteria bacterium]
MTGSILALLIAALAFAISHLVLASPPARDSAVGRIGEPAFLVLYSLLSIVLLAWMILAFAAAPYVELWPSGPLLGLAPVVLMPFAFILVIAGYFTLNPTALMQDGKLRSGAAPEGIIKITRHPAMWAIVLWAAAHILANGDLASLIFFGALLLVAVIGMAMIDRKKRLKLGADWERFAAATSLVPFAALIGGRTALTLGEIGWWKIAAGLAVYAVFLALHSWLFGVTPLPV